MKRLLLAVILLLFTAASAELAAGGSHALYLDGEGVLWAWGSNQKGESVPESAEERILVPEIALRDVKSIAAGRQISCAVTTDNTLNVWGSISLYIEGVTAVSACEEVVTYLTEDGRAHVYAVEKVDLPVENVVKTATAAEFVLLLTVDNCAYIYENSETRLLMENIGDISACGETGMLLGDDGCVYIFGQSGTEGRLGLDTTAEVETPVSNGITDARSLAAGLTCSCAISSDNRLYGWGMLYSYLSAFDENGDLLAAANAGCLINYGKTPIVIFEGIVDAAIGDAFIVSETQTGQLMTWGSNDQGQLGIGLYTRIDCVEDEETEEGYEISVLESNQGVFPEFIDIP